MKKIIALLLCLAISFAAANVAFAQDAASSKETKTEKEAGGILFNEGAICSKVTRMQFREGQNNHVYQNFLVGAYFSMQSNNLPVNLYMKIAGFYPLLNWYNGVELNAKQVILYGGDFFMGTIFYPGKWDYCRISLTPGAHVMYQLSDEYHLVYLGAGLDAGIELPVAEIFTLLLNGSAFLDYANLGSNKAVQKFDIAFQYQFEVGMRFSLDTPNNPAIFMKR